MISQEQYWKRVWNEVQPKLHAWSSSAHNEGRQYSSRVNKLDAELLDEEILQTLQDPLSKALRLINVRGYPQIYSTILNSQLAERPWFKGGT